MTTRESHDLWNGVQGVEGSNPFIPTTKSYESGQLEQISLASFIADQEASKGGLGWCGWIHPLSVVTVNRYGNFLKSFFNYAIRRGYIDRNPMAIWVKAFEPRKECLLDREMIEKIMANAPRHLAWAIEVAYNTGARTGYSELLSLKWSDVDYEQGLVHIYARKTKTDRWVPVSDEFLERLRLFQAQSKSEYIVSYAGKQVKNIHKSFRTACLRAGITEPARFYDVRHRFASELFNSNVPLGVVSRTIGHTRVSTTTDVYLEVLPMEIYDIRGKLPALKLPSSKHRQKGSDDKGKTGTD